MKTSPRSINNLEKCFVKDADHVTREIAGETIIVPIRGHVGDFGSIYTLNELGTMIWELIDSKNSVGQIIEAVRNAYEVAPGGGSGDVVYYFTPLYYYPRGPATPRSQLRFDCGGIHRLALSIRKK